jgi:hypothetical protein
MGDTTVTELEWLLGGDPRLKDLADQIASGTVGPDEARLRLRPLVGSVRANADWAMAVEKAGPKPRYRDQGLWELEAYEREFPRSDPRRRLQNLSDSTYAFLVRELGIQAPATV